MGFPKLGNVRLVGGGHMWVTWNLWSRRRNSRNYCRLVLYGRSPKDFLFNGHAKLISKIKYYLPNFRVRKMFSGKKEITKIVKVFDSCS